MAMGPLFGQMEYEVKTLCEDNRTAAAALLDYLRGLGAEKGLKSYFVTTDFVGGPSSALMDVGAVIGSTVHFLTLKRDGQIEGYQAGLASLGVLSTKTDRAGVTIALGPDIGKGWTIRAEGPRVSKLLEFVSYLTDNSR
jgi:hypothetical protein